MHIRSFLASVLVVALLGASALYAEEKKGKDAGKDAKKVNTGVAFIEAVSSADNPLGLSDAQKKSVETIVKTRDKEIESWDKTNKTKIEKAEERKGKLDPKKQQQECKAIELAIKQLEMQKEQISVNAERKAFAVLTAEQRGKWNGGILHEAVANKFRLLMLTDDQDKKLKELCETAGKSMAGPVPTDVKQREAIVEAIEKRAVGLLTAPQKKEYAEWNAKATKKK